MLFKQTKMIEGQIDQFLDAVSEGAIVFKEGIKNYLDHEYDKLEDRIITITKLENKADELRRSIENYLYSHSLIPEQRGDVLGLLESTDNVIDASKKALNQFSIEMPEIPEELNKDFLDLTEKAAQATESIVAAIRNFFRDVNAVKDHLHKVFFFEKEADKIAGRLSRRVFRMNLDLSHKIHLGHFVHQVDFIADRSEEVADRLAIYTIKRIV